LERGTILTAARRLTCDAGLLLLLLYNRYAVDDFTELVGSDLERNEQVQLERLESIMNDPESFIGKLRTERENILRVRDNFEPAEALANFYYPI
jgi:hypothetical protein